MISIIIPTFNRIDKLKRCLKSILSQRLPETEVIVIDDASTDGTWNWLEGHVKKKHVKGITYADNKGVNFARNRGVEAATQPYIMFIDSDDELTPGALKKITNEVKRNSSYKHFLFLLSNRSAEFENMSEERRVTYVDWMRGIVKGDFTHVVSTAIIKNYLFFEEFRMYEQLNWFRIYKATTPQLILPIITSKIETEDTDRLTAAHKLGSRSVIQTKFQSEMKFYEMYHMDLFRYNPGYLRFKLIENMMLGIASNKKKESRKLLAYTDEQLIRWIGVAVSIMPPVLMRIFIIQYSRLKNNLK